MAFDVSPDLSPKPVEMNILTLNHADHHPAQSFEMSGITPLNLTLTQILIQRIIESGSGSHLFC